MIGDHVGAHLVWELTAVLPRRTDFERLERFRILCDRAIDFALANRRLFELVFRRKQNVGVSLDVLRRLVRNFLDDGAKDGGRSTTPTPPTRGSRCTSARS